MSKVIAHFIATNFYGGPERQILNHTIRLKKSSDYEPIIISFQEGDKANELARIANLSNIRVYLISAQGVFNIHALNELYLILKNNNVDILVSHGYKANVIGRLVTCFVKIPVVVVSRGWTGENFKIKLYEKIDRIFLRFCNAIVAVSDGQKRKLIEYGICREKILTIRNAIDLSSMPNQKKGKFRSEVRVGHDAVLIATAGRLSPEKDQATLVEAANKVSGKLENVYFAVFGEGPLRPMLEEKICNYRIENFFFLPGFRKDLLSILCDVDIFVLPSLTEGLPNVILEAFACSIPVIATNVGGTPEIVSSGENGILVRPGDVESLAKSIEILVREKQLRKTMGCNGYEVVANKFGYCQQTKSYIKLYDRLLDRNLI